MYLLKFWTFCLVSLTLNPRSSYGFNYTDSIGAEVSFNETHWERATTAGPREKHELHIAGFFDVDSRNGAGSLGAAKMAVEEINSDSRYLEDYKIVLHKRSTKVGMAFILFFSFNQGQVVLHCLM